MFDLVVCQSPRHSISESIEKCVRDDGFIDLGSLIKDGMPLKNRRLIFNVWLRCGPTIVPFFLKYNLASSKYNPLTPPPPPRAKWEHFFDKFYFDFLELQKKFFFLSVLSGQDPLLMTEQQKKELYFFAASLRMHFLIL